MGFRNAFVALRNDASQATGTGLAAHMPRSHAERTPDKKMASTRLPGRGPMRTRRDCRGD
ncbi:hypothetical protein DNK49_19380 [Azoarcus communis]|uniref:Uncharacterized protein n=1 Tax=Parazoarcus communis SWub3 = DSM 12120 TaxID=1121029 RepID=A0A323UUI6_9RHOO|nr:hypothetical protein DNK49_19380 [Azoarcus communis] [Parazoarcus communis SWub3 = DSM 12120]